MQRGKQTTSSDHREQVSVENSFELKKFGSPSTCAPVKVNFSPVNSQSGENSNQQMCTDKELVAPPTFNMDKNFFTPAFILDVEKEKYVQNASLYCSLFKKRALEFDVEKKQMYVPKPSQYSSFCGVCKTVFEDYLTHVNLPMHKILMQKTEAHQYINQICANFNNSEQPFPKKVKKAATSKTKKVKKAPKNPKPKKTGIGSCSTSAQSRVFVGEELQLC